MNDRPVGIFDSGVGGLTVVKEFIKYLPNENIIYFGDTAHLPYGNKSVQIIKQFTYQNIQLLYTKKVKAVIIACNTASAIVLKDIKNKFDIPIIGVIEPGIKKALKSTKNKKIGIIGTYRTIYTQTYKLAIKKQDNKVKVYEQACPLFVPLVEEGWINKKITYLIAKEYLFSLKRKNIDTLILGCTHYPLLKKIIQKVMGKNIILINSAEEVVKEIYLILQKNNFLRKTSKKASYRFLVSDIPAKFEKISTYLLNKKIEKVELVKT